MDFFLAKERISLKRSFQLYWLYVLPFPCVPFLAIPIRATLPPTAASIVSGASFFAAFALGMWPVAFKDASNKLWLLTGLAWFISVVLAMFLSAVAGIGAA
ncbi:hypothetical protein [Dyella sp. S184]|uniref:hypothetical protein n=1 Tax=Dyella sp. S184 TaxID=1641862 RepID=UPI00131AC950|nr:hypothetical protein [Dyella sp. S184]